MSKQIKIPEELLGGFWCLLYQLKNYQLDDTMANLCNVLQKHVDDKLEALERREKFTAYKLAEKGTTSREKKRQEYLNLGSIHKNWRSKIEINYENA